MRQNAGGTERFGLFSSEVSFSLLPTESHQIVWALVCLLSFYALVLLGDFLFPSLLLSLRIFVESLMP